MPSQQPSNISTKENPVGRFMVASGAVIELADTGKILVVQRSSSLDWHPDEWEILYGRIGQFEDTEEGLRREISEESGITDLEIIAVLTVWHIFRGTAETAENELIGITYHCKTVQTELKLSDEHRNYMWVTPEQALEMVKVSGIKRDILKYIESRSSIHRHTAT